MSPTTSAKRVHNPMAMSLFDGSLKQRVVRPKRGKGSYRRKGRARKVVDEG